MRIKLFAAILVALVVCPAAGASHFAKSGWRDRHVRWPAVPSGYSAIVGTFGQPCNSNARANRTYWTTRDDGNSYPLNYHYSLGGYGKYYGGTGSTKRSSNLNNDVRGHIRNNHLVHHVLSGVWGYNCRYIAGTRKYSTHAWGIAVDINARYEHVGADHRHCHTVTAPVADVWKKHRWIHGVSFGDCMHFQYATDY